MSSKLILISFVLVLVAGGVGGWLWYDYQPGEREFILREDGWHPRSIVVEPGETVTFVNQSKHTFWPASNNHPAHDLYAEFDAGKPIAPGESWSFTFDRPGKWLFHDHLRSFYKGTIYVGQESLSYNCLDHFEGATAGIKLACWNEKLLEELEARGASAAFKLFAEFYRSDPDFTVVGCHIVSHTLGDSVYGLYLARGKDPDAMEFPPESVYCGYGYYHGILEHMIRDNPEYEIASAFCEGLIRDYEAVLPRIRHNCYHAIGHGFTPEPNNVELWGDPKRLTEPAIAACSQVPDNDTRQECYQGTFNVMGDWMWNNQFGLRFDKDNPLHLCSTYDNEEVSYACYYELSMRITPLVNADLPAAYEKFVSHINNTRFEGVVINSAAAAVIGQFIAKEDLVPLIEQCRKLPEYVADDCIHGFAGGLIAHGEPENEYVKAIGFCGDARLTAGEKDICYENIVRMFKSIYSQEKIVEVCAVVESDYQHYCMSS
jgi:hypothetical protein